MKTEQLVQSESAHYCRPTGTAHVIQMQLKSQLNRCVRFLIVVLLDGRSAVAEQRDNRKLSISTPCSARCTVPALYIVFSLLDSCCLSHVVLYGSISVDQEVWHGDKAGGGVDPPWFTPIDVFFFFLFILELKPLGVEITMLFGRLIMSLNLQYDVIFHSRCEGFLISFFVR